LKVLILPNIIGDYDHWNLVALAREPEPARSVYEADNGGRNSVIWRNYGRSLSEFTKGTNPRVHSAGKVQFNPAV
jgi:hypothetical protein